MPICTREGFDAKPTVGKNHPDKFHDNEEVFFCETTKEIFRDYEEYFRHVMLINSTIWQCEETGKENLTYAEALYSEKKARKKMETFKQILRAPTLLAIEKAQQSGYREVFNLVYTLLKDRYFLGEIVQACITSSLNSFHECKVIDIIKPNGQENSGNTLPVYDPVKIKYKVQKLSGVQTDSAFIVPFQNIKRTRLEFGRNILQFFIRDSVERVQGIIKPKPEAYKKYITNQNLNWGKLYIGGLPEWTPSKPKKVIEKKKQKHNNEAKQSSMNKYVSAVDAAEKMRQEQNLIEQMEKMRKEKEQKAAEAEQRRLELVEKIENDTKNIVLKLDDLERIDQKMLPYFHKVQTIVPSKYFDDFIYIQEFLHSFVSVLSGTDNAFQSNTISFFEMTRALTYREVAGPLSDILVVLLSTIFALQLEEDEECSVEYRKANLNLNEPWPTVRSASATQLLVRKHFSSKLFELPVDAQTLSEVLRLHLLGSGATTDDKSDRWRFMYRNGYYATEDAGLWLRMHQPHIVRALKMYSIYQLPMKDILKVIHCLISQILTYSNTLTIIDERAENIIKSKQRIRALITIENKRVAQISMEKKKLQIDLNLILIELKDDPLKRKYLEEELQKKFEIIDIKSAKEKKVFEQNMQKEYAAIFNFMVYLGMDRAYRKYYVFESMPGLFIEHSEELYDICSENPPQNWFELSEVPKNRNDVKKFLTKHYQQAKSKPNANKPTTATAQPKLDYEADKENFVNLKVNGELNGKVNGLPNGEMKLENHLNGDIKDSKTIPSQYELYMCTGNPKKCIVHDVKNSDRQKWSFISTEAEVEELIRSLNPLGEREAFLREQLLTYKPLLVDHIQKCASEIISVEEKAIFKKLNLQMQNETNRKYANSNFGSSPNCDLNEIMYAQCIERIMQLEVDVTTGCLGTLKVHDLQKWRQDLIDNKYNPQAELYWGIDEHKYEDPGVNLGDTLDIESEDSADEAICNYDSPELKSNVKNLSSALLQIEQGIEQKFFQAPFGLQKEIRDKEEKKIQLAKAQQKLKYWEISLMNAASYSSIFLHLNILYDSIKWRRSINSSSCIVCRRKSEPEKMLLCDECNAGTHMFCLKPKLTEIPEGNWYCRRCVEQYGYSNNVVKEKSKRRKFVPQIEEDDAKSTSSSKGVANERGSDSDEYLPENEKLLRRKEKKLNKLYKRQNLSEVEIQDSLENEELDSEGIEEDQLGYDNQADENEEAEEEDDESETEAKDENEDESSQEDGEEEEEEGACNVCSYTGCELACIGCKLEFHMECVGLRRNPRNNWKCPKCKTKEDKKRKIQASNPNTSDDEDYVNEPSTKKVKRNINTSLPSTSKRSRSSTNYPEDSKYIQNNRRSRRTGEDLPLNNVALYELLEEISKNDDSWPFLRPVSQHEVPDYYEIIKRPMDFAKIKSKLNMGQYRLNEEVLKDVQLIFQNCDAYNTMGNEIYNAGASLENFIIKKCKKLNLPFFSSDMNSN